MTDTPRYLDGFLAAVRPGHGSGTGCGPRPEIQPELTTPIPPPAALAPESLPEEERIKRRLHPLDSFARLVDCAASDRVPGPDDQFRFRWFGLFYQVPRQDAFLLRLRLPGGRLKAFQLAGLAEITQEHASGQIVLNPQGSLDIPGVPVRAAVEILRATEGIGLSARQTGGDCVQLVRGGEDDGLMADDPRLPFGPLVRALEQVLTHERALADLPRGCQVVFQRTDEPPEVDQEGETDTISLREVPAPPPSRVNGSGTGHAPDLLLRAGGEPEGGFLLPASRAVLGCVKLLQAWAAGADRTDRARAGLAPFCRALGREQVSALIEDATWQSWPASWDAGLNGAGSKLPRGFTIPGERLLSSQLSLIEKIIREHGLGEIRLLHGCIHVGPPVADETKAAIHQALAAV